MGAANAKMKEESMHPGQGALNTHPVKEPSIVSMGVQAADKSNTDEDKRSEYFDVVIAGAGPAGLLLNVLLARNSRCLPASSQLRVLCVEPRKHVTPAGHADGLHARSLEMFKLLGLYEELMKVSTEVGERARWAEVESSPEAGSKSGCDRGEKATKPKPKPRMERVMRQKVALAPNARMKQLISIPQGQVERILEEELEKNERLGATGALLRGWRVIESRLDETESYVDYPVVVKLQDETQMNDDRRANAQPRTRTVRCKYLVGADGAHSTVRKNFGITMEGDSTDHVWGVADFVVDTNFPDIRRLTTVQNSGGMAMVIPREQNAQGEWLTRFYVDMNDLETVRKKQLSGASAEGADAIFIKNQQRKSSITIDDIHQRLREIFAPFRMEMKQGTEVDWSTAYAIGQRVASEFTKADASGFPRVFLVGDACHTHSPKLGQGMNVSMADSFNLAWKLTHAVSGTAADPKGLLTSYVSERRLIAEQLIELDHRWYSVQWADNERKKQPGYQDECTKLYQDVSGFTSGCGIQYSESVIVQSDHGRNTPPVILKVADSEMPNSGMIKPGRRLLNTRTVRLADGCHWDVHDSLIPDGAGFKILVFCSRGILTSDINQSTGVLQEIIEQVMPYFSRPLLDICVVTPQTVYAPGCGPASSMKQLLCSISECDIWTLLPECVKRDAEMKVFCLSDIGYQTYGVDLDKGAVVVVRPDGIVGAVLGLDPGTIRSKLTDFLDRVLIRS